VSVVDVRAIGIGFAALLALVLITRPWRKHRRALSAEERIASDAGCVIVDVLSVVGSGSFEGVPIEVRDFGSLTGFARYLERPILRDLVTGAFAVEDGGRLYVHRASPIPPAVAAGPAPRKARRTIRPFRWIGAALLVAVVVGVVASLTAANVVPLSNAGVSAQPLQLAELAPSECAGMNLSHLVVATGSSTTGPNGGALILGRTGAGTYSITGGTGDDCIVAGGGAGTKNTLNGGGGGSDVCIGAPGATNTFKNCAAKY
jgi:hypothetical protein